jgi:hypothetical protein
VATTHIASSAIVVEHSKEGHAFGVQRPMYFVSVLLSESKVRYPAVQKLLYAILITSRKLRHYFDEYNIIVIKDFSLADILHNQDIKVGSGTGGFVYRLQATHCNQVSSSSQFYG